MKMKEKHLQQINKYNTPEDHRSHNEKVDRLLRALAIELKDLPFEKQRNIDYIINDLRDGYRFNWLEIVEHNRAFIA
ncbi:hypothetical protein LCGC14_0580040 [marine sediment metagenome]|uniref:Uncharacterized protein n=1 Tax=marine sediment metagenome TaxID=412755 RepID=A0A0F9S0D6_9ZZZZ